MSLTGSFAGKDLLVTWTRNPANEIPGLVFKDYEVKVREGLTLLRTEYVTVPSYTYYYDDMVGDQGLNPARSITVEVVERDTLLRRSLASVATFTNAKPAAPTFTVSPGFTTVRIQMGSVSDPDVAGYMVFRSTTNGFTPSALNLVYKGPDNNVLDAGLTEGTTYYYRVAAYDLFDDSIAGQNFSSQLSTTTVTVSGEVTDYTFQNIVFTPNPSTNVISWTAGTVIRTKSGVVTTFSTTSGSATWTTGTLYIYYDADTNTIASSTSLTTALGSANRRIIASYKGGTNVIDGTSEPIIDGSKIIANTIGAGQLVTGSAVITGTAQIADAVIESANIKDLSVERIKIANGAVSDSGAFSVFPDGGIVMEQVSEGFALDTKLNVNANTYKSVAYGAGRFVAVSSTGFGSRVMSTRSDVIKWEQYRTPIDNAWSAVTYGNNRFVAVSSSGDNSRRAMYSFDGINWTLTSTPTSSNAWTSVTWGNGLFVAVAESGTGNRVMTSPDGINWTLRTSAADNNWQSVRYGTPGGNPLFVAVSNTGTGNRVMTSPDGITWTIRTSAADQPWNDVAWGNGRFVAVSESGTNRAMYSLDGITWTSSNTGTNRAWSSITFGDNIFVAVARSTGSGFGFVITSPDGITWTNRDSIGNQWESVIYGDGKFVAVSDLSLSQSSSVNGISSTGILKSMSSNNGIDWTLHFTPYPYSNEKIVYDNGLFVSVTLGPSNNTSNQQIRTSVDGLTWTFRETPFGVWKDIIYGNGTWVAVSSRTGVMISINNGVNWQKINAGGTDSWESITFGNGLFVAVGPGPTNKIMTSPDGITWTYRTSPILESLSSVTFGNGLFVAVADTGIVTQKVITSADGITWTARNAPNTKDWTCVSYGTPGGNPLFVAIAESGDGTTNQIITSPDGITWTARNSAADIEWVDVIWGNGLFVAVASTGITNRVMTSPDGITWTIRTTPQQDYVGVAWGNGRFVAVAAASENNPVDDDLVATSLDGITWTALQTLEERVANQWSAVVDGNGVFVAVAKTGTNRIMTSIDGKSWTLRPSPVQNAWSSVTWGNGLFVAIAESGTGNRVMTSPDGFNWTARTSAGDFNWQSVTVGTVSGAPLYVAVANTGTAAQRVMTSPDGITWTLRSAPNTNNWTAVTWGNNLFVAVSNTGTANRVMTSPDGVTWTARTSAADLDWRAVTFGNGTYVAVASSGTGNRVMTSTNGTTWTSRTSAVDNNWTGVTFGEGLFLAVSSTGTGNRAMTSRNGITWTARTTPVDVAFTGVSYGSGAFVAVGSSTPVGGSKVLYSVSTTGVFYTIPDKVYYYIGEGLDAEYRLILEPGLYGSGTTLLVNNPAVTDNVVCRFTQGITVYRYNDATLSGTPVIIAQRSQKTLECEWTNLSLYRSVGSDDVESFVSPIVLNLGVDYEPGNVIMVELNYASYSSNPSIANIKRTTPGFGFLWSAFWK